MKRSDILNDLITRLDRGDWDRGDLLPPLRAFAETYDTNPQTVANALAALSLMGRVRTTPRGSHVVVGRRTSVNLGSYKAVTPGQRPTSTQDWKAREGDGASESPTRIEILTANAWMADLLGVNEGDGIVVRHRTRSTNGYPVQYKRTALPRNMALLTTPDGSRTPMMEEGDIVPPDGKSVAQWLGMGVTRVEYRTVLHQSDREEAVGLNLKEGVPILRVTSKGVRADGSTAFATVTSTPANTEVVMCIETEE